MPFPSYDLHKGNGEGSSPRPKRVLIEDSTSYAQRVIRKV